MCEIEKQQGRVIEIVGDGHLKVLYLRVTAAMPVNLCVVGPHFTMITVPDFLLTFLCNFLNNGFLVSDSRLLISQKTIVGRFYLM